MPNYYFVATSVPALTVGEPPETTFDEFIELVEANFSCEDMKSVGVIQRLVNLNNLAAYWKGQSLDRHGSLTKDQIDEALAFRIDMSDYLIEFLEEHETTDARLKGHGKLMADYFAAEIPKAKGFLRSYLEFEREWRLVMVALRAAHLGRELGPELQFEPADDELVMQLMNQGIPSEYDGLEAIYVEHTDDPIRLHLKLEAYRFNRVYELVEAETFTLDWILGYMIRLMIIQRWQEIHEHGSRVVA